MEMRTGERIAFQDIICETWALSGGLATWLATSLNKVGKIQARKQGEAKTCQVFIYMSDALTRARNQNSPQFLPTSFITPPCLCPCHCTVEHAACFLLDGWTESVKAWEHQEPDIFFKLVYNRLPKDGGWVSSCGMNKLRPYKEHTYEMLGILKTTTNNGPNIWM